MKEYPIPTMEDANRFLAAFSTRHPDIAKMVTNPVMDMTGYIDVFWNKDATENDKSTFARYRNRWLFENGFADKKMDEIYLSLNDGANMGVRAMDTETIINVKGVNDKLTAIEFKEPDMDKPITIFVKGFVEDLRKEIYIF